MILKNYQYRILNVLLGMVILAPFHWLIHYDQLKMIGITYFLYCIITSVIVGGLGVFLFKRSVLGSAGWTTLGFILTVLIRIIWEGIRDPASHNLFPFEILIIAIYSFPASLLGARFADR